MQAREDIVALSVFKYAIQQIVKNKLQFQLPLSLCLDQVIDEITLSSAEHLNVTWASECSDLLSRLPNFPLQGDEVLELLQEVIIRGCKRTVHAASRWPTTVNVFTSSALAMLHKKLFAHQTQSRGVRQMLTSFAGDVAAVWIDLNLLASTGVKAHDVEELADFIGTTVLAPSLVLDGEVWRCEGGLDALLCSSCLSSGDWRYRRLARMLLSRFLRELLGSKDRRCALWSGRVQVLVKALCAFKILMNLCNGRAANDTVHIQRLMQSLPEVTKYQQKIVQWSQRKKVSLGAMGSSVADRLAIMDLQAVIYALYGGTRSVFAVSSKNGATRPPPQHSQTTTDEASPASRSRSKGRSSQQLGGKRSRSFGATSSNTSERTSDPKQSEGNSASHSKKKKTEPREQLAGSEIVSIIICELEQDAAASSTLRNEAEPMDVAPTEKRSLEKQESNREDGTLDTFDLAASSQSGEATLPGKLAETAKKCQSSCEKNTQTEDEHLEPLESLAGTSSLNCSENRQVTPIGTNTPSDEWSIRKMILRKLGARRRLENLCITS